MPDYALVFVGCLECGDPTVLLGVFDDYQAAVAAFESAADKDRLPIVDMTKLMVKPGTAIALAGSGGSYWYPLQLHKGRQRARKG